MELSGYYCKFIKGYAPIAIPLIDILKTNQFIWTDEAQQAFDQLKQALSSLLILVLPDFSKQFIKAEKNY